MSYTELEEKWYMKAWVAVLFLIFFPPVGIFLMYRYQDWSKNIKMGLSAASIVFWIVMVIIGINNQPDYKPTHSLLSNSTISTSDHSKRMESSTSSVDSKTSESSLSSEVSESESSVQPVSKAEESKAPPAESSKSIETPVSSAAPIEEPVKQEEPVAEEPSVDPNESIQVYYTQTGECYHYENPCGRGKYYPCTLAEALRKGLRPCEKCVLH